MSTLRIATRKSPLALWQAEEVKRLLSLTSPNLKVELVKLSTQGDQILDQSLSKIGGKGLFVKELERALLDDRADIAVHSMKDVPMLLPDGLELSVILERDDPRDAFVSNHYNELQALPENACVGTSSLRRKMQLMLHYPTLQIKDLRGNVGTRLSKLDNGDYDAIILAAAGLNRLGLKERIASHLSTQESLPAIGQAAIGIECRQGDAKTQALIQPLAHKQTTACVLAERALNTRLEGGCHFPIAGFAQFIDEKTIRLSGMIGSPDGDDHLSDEIEGLAEEAESIGFRLAQRLLERGGDTLLTAFRSA